jgi:glycosyltransferase involved in cell wall biosynthesis
MMERLRILQLTQRFFPALGGVEEHVLQISKRLVNAGHYVTIYTSDLEKDKPFTRLKGPLNIDMDVKRFTAVKILDLRHGLGIIAPSMLLDAVKYEADIVHAHGFGYWPTFVGAVKKALSGVPLVITPHSSPGSRNYSFLDIRMLPLKLADKVIALTRIEKEHLKSLGLDGRKIEVIPNGINFKDYASIKSFPKENIILYIGRIAFYKGLDSLLEAIPYVLKKVKEAKFLIVGPDWGEVARLKRKAIELRIKEHVSFIGSVFGNEKLRYYAMAKVCVFPSYMEAFGIAILEAMASGRPVVATNVGGITELIDHGKTGFLVPPKEPKALANAISYLLCNPEIAMEIGERARLVARKFTWEETLHKTLNVYKCVLKRYSPMAKAADF